MDDNDESKGPTIPTSIEEAVIEFTKARQDRIAVRRARIAQKITEKKNAEIQITGEVASIASSLEFLQGADEKSVEEDRQETPGGDKKRPGTALSKKSGKEKKGKDEGKKTQSASGQLDLQIEESRKQLEQAILDGEVLITNVKVAAEYREKTRQIKHEENHKERLARLRLDAEESQAMYDALSQNWNMQAEKILPMEMYKQMKAQQDACDELLAKKDEIITGLRREIDENDFEYDGTLEKYQKDSMLMGDRIDDLVDDLRVAFVEELTLIEDYTCKNREVILEDNQNEWMDLLQDFENMEQKNLEERKADAIAKFQILNDLFTMTKQESRQLRHKMEDDLRILMQEREQIKYACHINLEKMAYNLHILQCRSKENVELKNMMKRFLLQLHDKFDSRASSLKKKMQMGTRQTEKLCKEIERLESQVSTFGSKTLHLAVSDHRKFIDLWEANEELLREKVKSMLDSDKFIFETQLGVEFPMPDMTVLDERPSIVNRSFRKRSSNLNTSKNMRKIATPAQDLISDEDEDTTSKDEVKLKGHVDEDPTIMACAPTASLLITQSKSLEFLPGPEPDPAIQRRLMKGIARVVCDQSGFIVEEELQKILEPLIETEQNLVNLDAVLQALGITNVDEMQSLARHMLRYCKVMRGVMSKMSTDASAHLTEMNLSMDGIIGKGALEEFGSDSSDRSINNALSGTDTESKECRLDPANYCDCHMKKESTISQSNKKDIKGKKGSKSRRKIPKNVQTDKDLEGHKLEETEMALVPYGEDVSGEQKCYPICCSPPPSNQGSFEDVLEGIDSDEELQDALDEAEEGSEEEVLELTASQIENMGPDCSFVSNKATVLSWLETVDRERIIENFKQYNEEMLGEDEEAEEFVERTPSTKQLLLPELSESHSSTSDNTAIELNSRNDSESKAMSINSVDSSSDASDEFLYIEPDDVIKALKTFIEDYNSRQKVVLPTTEEIVAQKLAKIKYPSYSDVAEYWEGAYKLLNFKGKDLWDTVQQCFEKYNKVLQDRNEYVQDIQKYYQQNYELSHLLQRHMQSISKYSSASTGTYDTGNIEYC